MNIGIEAEIRGCTIKEKLGQKLVNGRKLGEIETVRGKKVTVEVEGVDSGIPYVELQSEILKNKEEVEDFIKCIRSFYSTEYADAKSEMGITTHQKVVSVQINNNVPFSKLVDSEWMRGFEKYRKVAEKVERMWGVQTEEEAEEVAKRNSFMCYWLYKASVYVMYGNPVYTNKIKRITNYKEYIFPAEIENRKPENAYIGTKRSIVKTHFELLIKASEVDILSELFTSEERNTIKGILETIKIEDFADIFKRSNKEIFEKYKAATISNIDAVNAGNDVEAYLYSFEPRVSAILPVNLESREVVVEQRNEYKNTKNEDLKKYIQEVIRNEMANIEVDKIGRILQWYEK